MIGTYPTSHALSVVTSGVGSSRSSNSSREGTYSPSHALVVVTRGIGADLPKDPLSSAGEAQRPSPILREDLVKIEKAVSQSTSDARTDCNEGHMTRGIGKEREASNRKPGSKCATTGGAKMFVFDKITSFSKPDKKLHVWRQIGKCFPCKQISC